MRSKAAASAASPTSVPSPYISGFASANWRRFTGPAAGGGVEGGGGFATTAGSDAGAIVTSAIVASGLSAGSRYPIKNGSSCFHAFALCTASKSSVLSVPAFMTMLAFPPGCAPLAMYAVQSYTLSFTRIHASSSESCFSISASEKIFAPAGGGRYPVSFGGSSSTAVFATLAVFAATRTGGATIFRTSRRFTSPTPFSPDGVSPALGAYSASTL
mmetsp:Transcript_1801/g.5925  ORF Transcript_1801/g.5925 Transcript_1801/m.5925 type:complete len:215 (+) Transcript_1801:1038-1682(+)